MSFGFSSQALCLLLVSLAPCLGQSPSATQMAVYVLDIDTNIKGEFSSVAPELTEALQTAFSEKRNAFKILERRHLDQLVKANQLEKDLQAISHGEPASAQFVRQVRADGFIRGELVDSPDGLVLTVTLVNLNSEVMWQGQASESRAGWLLHETQKRDATKLAGEAEAHFTPSNSSRDHLPSDRRDVPTPRPNTSSSGPSPVNQSDSPSSSTGSTGVVASDNYLAFTVRNCELFGRQLKCLGSVTNRDEKRRAFGIGHSSYLVDDSGNQFPITRSKLGATELEQELEPDLPMSFEIYAGGLPSTLSRISLVLRYVVRPRLGVSGLGYNVLLRNISVSQK
jgi:hypothetical protein